MSGSAVPHSCCLSFLFWPGLRGTVLFCGRHLPKHPGYHPVFHPFLISLVQSFQVEASIFVNFIHLPKPIPFWHKSLHPVFSFSLSIHPALSNWKTWPENPGTNRANSATHNNDRHTWYSTLLLLCCNVHKRWHTPLVFKMFIKFGHNHQQLQKQWHQSQRLKSPKAKETMIPG